jgi:syntaxin 1B/2/3
MKQNMKEGTADYRMCASQHLALAKQFREIVLKYHDLQNSYREKQKARFERQYRIVNPGANDSEIKRVLDEDYSGPVFADTILNSTLMEEAKTVLRDVQLRHDEIVRLAKSIMDLQLLFEEISTLVTRQDDMVNQVSFQVSNAAAYTENATQQLNQAIKSAHARRRRRWCLSGLCVALIITIVLIVIFVVVPQAQAVLGK